MWQDTPRKLKPVAVRSAFIRFPKRGALPWIILIVVLAAVGLVVLLLLRGRP